MADYDISQAFAEIEDKLISSMMRNLKHHKAEETKEGFKWSQWQVEQLKALEEYKANNKKLFDGRFDKINTEIENAIQNAYKQGGMEQEIKILKAIKNGYKPPVKDIKSTKTTGEFFKLNERKLNALIKSTTSDMKKAEQAVLRRANDHYRKIIYNAQVYANAGGTTYEKTVDMATRDFLRSGIDCIEYSNGARHTISDYADMAVKTANKRAYLRGEGTKREEWGIHTVIVNKRGNPCPLCLPWVGEILIDDVYSGGTSKEAEETGYSLLSEAMADGFLHPRCQDAFTTYFEGISTPPEQEQVTADEEQTIKENNSLKQKQQYHQLMAEKCHRIADNSLDEDNKRIYTARATEHTRIADEIGEKITDEPVVKFAESGIIKENIIIPRSVGAAGRNYPVRLPDGNHTKFAEGTEITNIKVFAGKGTDVEVRDAIFLENRYNIPAKEWQKIRGNAYVVVDGKKMYAEIHWYEAFDERVNMKVKRYLDES